MEAEVMYVGPLRRGQNEALAQERRRVIAEAALVGVFSGVAEGVMGWIAPIIRFLSQDHDCDEAAIASYGRGRPALANERSRGFGFRIFPQNNRRTFSRRSR
jgi:hypothetical protein